MKNSLKTPNLWQKKRNELPISEEPQKDWLAMQSLLDLHLPVLHTHPVATGSKAVKVSKIAKIVKAIKTIKASSLLFASLTAATCAGIIVYSVKTKNKQEQQQHRHKKNNPVNGKDTLLNNTTDTLNLTDSTRVEKDSIYGLKSPVAIKDTGVNFSTTTNAPVKSNNLINNKSTSPLINNTVLKTANNSNKNATVFMVTSQNQHPITAFGILNGPINNRNQILSQAMNVGSRIIPINGQDAPVLLSGSDSPPINQDLAAMQSSSKTYLSSVAGGKQGEVNANKDSKRANKSFTKPSKSSQKPPKVKAVTNNNLLPSTIDWGILAGVNSSGSFTAKNYNTNIYGKLPVDLYFGLFATYHLNDKWAINSQVRVLNPQNLNSSFTHIVNENKVDSGKVLTVTDTRKAYFVSVPIHLVYKINNNVSVKAGPVINIPVKQVSNSSILQPGIKLDSAYNITVSNQLKAIKYDQKINLGISGGLSLQYKRLILEATYLKSFSDYNVISDFGNYKSNKGTVQITLGFQLNRIKL
jgi:hypothetical protein